MSQKPKRVWRPFKTRVEKIVEFLKQYPDVEFTPYQIAQAIGMRPLAVRRTLREIKRKYPKMIKIRKPQHMVHVKYVSDWKKEEEEEKRRMLAEIKWRTFVHDPIPFFELPKDVEKRLIDIINEFEKREFESFPIE
jgi:hypothetical protein